MPWENSSFGIPFKRIVTASQLFGSPLPMENGPFLSQLLTWKIELIVRMTHVRQVVREMVQHRNQLSVDCRGMHWRIIVQKKKGTIDLSITSVRYT